MLLSAVVITYNRKHLLASQIAAIEAMEDFNSPDFEVVYIDNNSKDGTDEELKSLLATRPKFRAFCETQQGSSFARNRGAKEARGDWVWYLDDDSLPAPQALSAYLKALPEFKPQLATGPIVPVANTPVPWWFDVKAHEFSSYLARCDYGNETRLLDRGQAWGPNLVVLKSAFYAVGGFNKKLGVFAEGRGGGEETELQNRMVSAGAKLLYVHNASVDHLVLPKQMIFKNYLNQRYHRGISEARDSMLRGFSVPGALATTMRIGGHAAAACLRALLGRTASAVDHAGACYGLYGRWSEGRRWKRNGEFLKR